MNVPIFNIFPYDFYWVPPEYTSRRPSSRKRFVRAIWDGTTLKIYGEENKTISLLYEVENPTFVKFTTSQKEPLLLKWVDPKTELQFSIDGSGCKGCNARAASKLKLARTLNP